MCEGDGGTRYDVYETFSGSLAWFLRVLSGGGADETGYTGRDEVYYEVCSL